MQEIGIEHVYPFEGGILKYFEEVGGALNRPPTDTRVS